MEMQYLCPFLLYEKESLLYLLFKIALPVWNRKQNENIINKSLYWLWRSWFRIYPRFRFFQVQLNTVIPCRILFNVRDGTQRLCAEHSLRLSRLKVVFISRLSVDTLGGLPGMVMRVYILLFRNDPFDIWYGSPRISHLWTWGHLLIHRIYPTIYHQVSCFFIPILKSRSAIDGCWGRGRYPGGGTS